MSDPQEEALTVYSVRITTRAKRDIEAALIYTEDQADSEIARSWLIGLYGAFATLGTLPRRCPVATESSHFPPGYEVRQHQYRRSESAVIYRILFRVRGETEDGPVISILHVRHAARRPMTRKEAREIQGQEHD